jgi:hypothetical protein
MYLATVVGISFGNFGEQMVYFAVDLYTYIHTLGL